MDKKIIKELSSALEGMKIGVVPQEDGRILIIGSDMTNLEKAAIIISNMGYVVSYKTCNNYLEIQNFTKYECVIPNEKLPSSELTEAKLYELMQNFPSLCIIKQSEGVFAIIGNDLHSAEYKLRSSGFNISTFPGNFFEVYLLHMKNSAQEKSA